MKLSPMRRTRGRRDAAVIGAARLDRRTMSLVQRLRPGDIAVIDHVDLDRAAAVALLDAQVAAVVNVAPSISGRYPNLGPQLLVEAGVCLLDDVGSDVFTALDEGDSLRLLGDTVYVGEDPVAVGVRQDADSVAASMAASRQGMASRLEALSVNVVEHLRRNQQQLLDAEGVPSTTVLLQHRPVVVVLRAFDHQGDLRGLKTFIRENKPVLIGVDGGADVLVTAGHRPDVVVTSGDGVSENALRRAGEVVGHSTASGSGGDLQWLDELNIPYRAMVGSGTSEDAAILLAHAGGASLIVMVGSHTSLVEFMDKGRSGMASSFLTRTAAGSRLVDAAAVSQLYRHRVRGWLVLLLLLLGVAAVLAAVATTPVGQGWYDDVSGWLRRLLESLQRYRE
ncbi:MAG: FIG005773: conserved membrane protein ML1361 [uncultured Nocardioidaceae bacterium]|uniref:FIG005773: conserved membrane protein ML1361 n=1 Tax=uncultured Nocardioidaceae bacterium TaxID=253824 RepID=A0A6J4NCQ3_9ACTN|nr:MAG: FIG005773: conserved membrane protein ML1361 [uncultured Nocardioidaceae bacterium]